ncbi:hypothetical protein [Brevundimonas sp.]|uniref:hypothetical protein n=1 Tax=Brevundimonas sp. TaxID=1871086 RepID=UPI0025BE9C96|nr:hypothetical protein [Brevundimonas sp.]
MTQQKPPARPVDSPAQADKFRDMARELECDEDEAAFEEKVRRVATAPKSDHPEPHE